MKSLNRVTLLGCLGKDVEMSYTPSEIPSAKFSLATNERYKVGDEYREETTWHNIVCWRNLADLAGKFLKKGSKIYLEGKIKTRSWGGSDDAKHYITEIIADEMIFLGENRGGEQGPSPKTQQSKPKPAPKPVSTLPPASSGRSITDDDPITDLDIPF